jgi:hypothetical protein
MRNWPKGDKRSPCQNPAIHKLLKNKLLWISTLGFYCLKEAGNVVCPITWWAMLAGAGAPRSDVLDTEIRV